MADKLPSSIGLNIQTPDTIPGRYTRKQRLSEQRQTCHTCESSHDHRAGNASKHGGGRVKEGYVTGGWRLLIPPSRSTPKGAKDSRFWRFHFCTNTGKHAFA